MLIKQMTETIREFTLLEEHDHIVVGVSGGPDSLALLEGLHQLAPKHGWQLTVVHVHHQLRGDEADEDAEFVRLFCQARGLSCEICRVDVKGQLKLHGGNLQDVARRLRYDAFLDIARKVGAHKLALGHHADDQAETMVMRFLRGSGLSGLKGIPVKRRWEGLEIVRPLWRVERQQIETFCREHHLSPRYDSSNQSIDYLRNRIRTELMPELETYNPRLKTGLLQLSEQCAAEEEMWKAWTKQAAERVMIEEERGVPFLRIAPFCELSLALQRRVIQLILGYLHIRSWTHTEGIRKLIQQSAPSARLSLPGDWQAVRDYDVVWFCRKMEQRAVDTSPIQLNVPGWTALPSNSHGGGYFETIMSDHPVQEEKWGLRWAVFDASQITGRLYVRLRRSGDRIHIMGMTGRKKVKDLFMDEKVSRQERDRWPIITDETDILWIPGLRRSRKALVSSQTAKRIYLIYHGPEDD